MSYVTLSAQPWHRDELLRLWRENLADLEHRSDLPARSTWAYRDKPEGPARTIVVVDEESGEMIGCGSAYPRVVTLGGVRLLAGILADFAVSRLHRSGGAALQIQRALATEGPEPPFSFLYGLPNEPALPVFMRVGYTAIGAVQAWVKPLHAAYKLREYMSRGSFAQFAAVPVDSYLAAADARRARRFPASQSSIVARADQRFDDLWLRAGWSYALTGERTAAYLNWRYAAPTSMTHEFYCLRENGRSDLLGYVVFSRQDNKILVHDLFAEDLADATERLLLGFTCDMRDAGYDSVFIPYFGDSRVARCLSRTGFVFRGEQERRVVVMTRSVTPEHAQSIAVQGTWCLFSGDMDF